MHVLRLIAGVALLFWKVWRKILFLKSEAGSRFQLSLHRRSTGRGMERWGSALVKRHGVITRVAEWTQVDSYLSWPNQWPHFNITDKENSGKKKPPKMSVFMHMLWPVADPAIGYLGCESDLSVCMAWLLHFYHCTSPGRELEKVTAWRNKFRTAVEYDTEQWGSLKSSPVVPADCGNTGLLMAGLGAVVGRQSLSVPSSRGHWARRLRVTDSWFSWEYWQECFVNLCKSDSLEASEISQLI